MHEHLTSPVGTGGGPGVGVGEGGCAIGAAGVSGATFEGGPGDSGPVNPTRTRHWNNTGVPQTWKCCFGNSGCTVDTDVLVERIVKTWAGKVLPVLRRFWFV